MVWSGEVRISHFTLPSSVHAVSGVRSFSPMDRILCTNSRHTKVSGGTRDFGDREANVGYFLIARLARCLLTLL